MEDMELQLIDVKLYKNLMLIIAILVHDCAYKFMKIFFFSRYKPAGLEMTTAQLIGPVFDTVFAVLNLIAIAKQMQSINRYHITGVKYHNNQCIQP